MTLDIGVCLQAWLNVSGTLTQTCPYLMIVPYWLRHARFSVSTNNIAIQLATNMFCSWFPVSLFQKLPSQSQCISSYPYSRQYHLSVDDSISLLLFATSYLLWDSLWTFTTLTFLGYSILACSSINTYCLLQLEHAFMTLWFEQVLSLLLIFNKTFFLRATFFILSSWSLSFFPRKDGHSVIVKAFFEKKMSSRFFLFLQL